MHQKKTLKALEKDKKIYQFQFTIIETSEQNLNKP